MSNKKLLICYHSAQYGGIEKQILDIATYLKNDLQIYIACPEGPMVKKYIDAGAQYIDLSPKSEFDKEYISKLMDLIKTEKIEIVHGHELFSGFQVMYSAWRCSEICKKRVFHVHTSFFEWKHSGLKKYFAVIPNFAVNFIGGNFFATDVLALTSDMFDIRKNKEKIFANKIRVIPNGVDLDFLKYDENYSKNLRNNFHLPQDSTIIGCISRFTEEKGHKILINAFAQIKDLVPNLYLLLAGGGKLLDECKKQVKELGVDKQVIFTGFFEEIDKPKILSAIDLYVIPSYAEGFGIALVEGLAASKPIISSDLKVLKHVGGDSVVYFKSGSVTDLKHTMRHLIESKSTRDNLSVLALNKASDYSMEKFRKNYLDLYLN